MISKTRLALVFLLTAIFAFVSRNLSGQDIGYYYPIVADFELKGNVRELRQMPGEVFDTKTNKFVEEGEADGIEVFQFGKDGALITDRRDIFVAGGGLRNILAINYQYNSGHILESITQYNDGKLNSVIRYDANKERNKILLKPRAEFYGNRESSVLTSYTYVVIVGSNPVVQILKDSSEIQYEVHFSSDWAKTSIIETYPDAGQQKAYKKTLIYSKSGQILREYVSGFVQAEYMYDKSDLCVAKTVYSLDKEKKTTKYRFEYSLDSRGNWIERKTYLDGTLGKKPLRLDSREIVYYN